MVTLSVVLPTYNRSFILETFLESLLKQSYCDWELIIVNDASQDNTLQVVSKYVDYDGRIHLRHLRNHKGLPAARNVGVASSEGSLIFFGEDDITFNDENGLKVLVNTYFNTKEYSRVGAVGPRLKNTGYKWLNDVVKIGPISGWIYHNFEYNSRKVIEVPILHACSLIPKEVFQNVGGYDEKLYTGTHAKEEVDFYYRIRRKGYKLFFQPKSIILHHHIHHGGCEKRSLMRVYYYEFRNTILFFSKFYGVLYSFRIIPYPILRLTFPKRAL